MIDQGSHHIGDVVVGHRNRNRHRGTGRTGRQGHRDRHHVGVDHRPVQRLHQHRAVQADAAWAGVTDAGQHLRANAVDRASASAADRHRRAAAARSRRRAGQHQRLDLLVVQRTHTQAGGRAAWLGAHNGRPINQSQDHVVRTLGLLHPELVVAVVLGQKDLVGLAVVVAVLALEILIADVFVHIVGAHPRVRRQAHGVAFFDGLWVVGAGVVGGFATPALGVITDVVARQRQADGRAHACRTAAAHAQRGRHDGRLDARRIARRQVHWRAHPQITVGHLNTDLAENHIDRARTGAGHPHSHGAAYGHRSRSRSAHHADARVRAGVQGQATAEIGLNVAHQRGDLVVDHIARQRHTDRHRHGGVAGQRSRDRGRGCHRADGRAVLSADHQVGSGDAAGRQAHPCIDACVHLHANEVFCPDARSIHRDAHIARRRNRRRARQDHRVYGLLGVRPQHQIAFGMDRRGLDQRAHGGTQTLATPVARLTDEVARHRHTNRDGHAILNATAQGHRDGGHHRRDACAAVGIEQQVTRGVDRAAIDQRRGRTCDRIERQRACATDGHAVGAQAQGCAHGGSSHHRADARASDAELAVVAAQLPGLAADIRHLPTLPSLDHRDAQGRLNQRPSAGIAVVFGGQRHRTAVFANELVDAATLAAKSVVRFQSDGVALEHLAGVVGDQFPARRVFVVFQREIDLFLVGGLEAVDLPAHHASLVARGARSQPGGRVGNAHPLALDQVLLAGVAAEVPGHTIGRGVDRRAVQGINARQGQPLRGQRSGQRKRGLRVGKITGQNPTRGVGVVFLPQRHTFLGIDLLPQLSVVKVRAGQVDLGGRTLVFIDVVFELVGLFVVAGHGDKIALVQGLFFVLGAEVGLDTDKAVDPPDHAAVAVARRDLNGVAGLHLLLVDVHTLPVRARVNAGIAQIHGLAGGAGVFVDLARLQAAGADRGGGDHHLVARLHGGRPLVAAEVPDLSLATGAAGFATGVGGRVHGGGVKAQVLPVHGKQILCRRRSRHHSVAAGGAQVHASGRGQHIGVYAVEGNRQANRHRNTVASTSERRCQRSRPGDRVYAGAVPRLQAGLASHDRHRLSMAAFGQGVDLAGNAIFGIHTGRADRDRRTGCAGTDGRCTGHHRRRDAGMALRIQPEFAAGVDRRVGQPGQGLGDRRLPAHQGPTALVTKVLQGQVYALVAFDRFAHIAVGLAAERGGIVEHGLPGRQRGQALVHPHTAPAQGVRIVLGRQVYLAKGVDPADRAPALGIVIVFGAQIDAQLRATGCIAEEFVDLVLVAAGGQAHPLPHAQIGLACIAAVVVAGAQRLEDLARHDAGSLLAQGQRGRLHANPVTHRHRGLFLRVT